MHSIKYLLHYLFLFLFILSPLVAKEDHRVEEQPVAIEKAKTLLGYGTLKQKENGFVYLDVSNEFIKAILPLIDHEGELRPRPMASRSIGAHISVFYEKENIVPDELGSNFSFDVKEMRSFTLNTRDGLKKLWVIAVHSPELENLREAYGCTPKLKGHDFHISLAKQMPTAPENWKTIETLSPLNFTEGDFVTLEREQFLSTASKADAIGQLKLKENGSVYLDVNPQFVDELLKKLPLQGAFEPATKVKRMKAHISVIHEDEMIKNEIWNLQEAGEWFTLKMKELRYEERKTKKGPTRLWLLTVEAPALERLRSHYGLKRQLQGYDFHIPIGEEAVEAELLIAI